MRSRRSVACGSRLITHEQLVAAALQRDIAGAPPSESSPRLTWRAGDFVLLFIGHLKPGFHFGVPQLGTPSRPSRTIVTEPFLGLFNVAHLTIKPRSHFSTSGSRPRRHRKTDRCACSYRTQSRSLWSGRWSRGCRCRLSPRPGDRRGDIDPLFHHDSTQQLGSARRVDAADYELLVSDDASAWRILRTVTDGDGGVDELTGLTAGSVCGSALTPARNAVGLWIVGVRSIRLADWNRPVAPKRVL